ncbi:hypothetical protein KVV02_005809 [Mortierella alpina]|uniref:Protein kinase domain-containing protein n=1 Tax=Mortierella alpina TaxID=64518 RepID=A0A9P8AAM4_MORAP|nr:hypothetical protein KVV02_005809 [Mortierella alpina]
MANDRTQSAQVKKNSRAEEWLKNAVKDKHVRMIPFSEISKVKYNVAKGGSGTIHLGAWRNMHIAIKEQHNTNDLIKELKMHKQVHDSNYIVKFFGITKHPLTHDTCIVMQFAENGCLQDYLETQNVSITWLTKYRLAWEIASGLDFIHRENIFHTDLHSRNILIDTGGKALITDFGLSKSVNKTIYTTKAGLFGVVPYVAPERMQNPTYTYNAKCDIYSLGVIFWELSSCVIPFEMQLQDVMLAVNIIAGVREKTVPGTAVEYEMLYRRCWDGLPQNRPNMEIVLSELVELLAAEQINPRAAAPRPISPRPPRPLSGESMIAPSTPFPYDNDAPLQSSPENTNYMRPASPPSQWPGARQSFAQGLTPLGQGIPSVPIRQDRTGARVSFMGGDQPAKANGGPAQAADQTRNPSNANNNNNNDNNDTTPANARPNPTNARPTPATLPDSPTVTMTAHVPPTATASSATAVDQQGSQNEPFDPSAPLTSQFPSTPQLLPPIPSFKALALTTPPKDITIPPATEPNSVLPETASLALASGLSMVSVVSKLNLGSLKTISTISPPPPGAPPPPPTAVANQANAPRMISPPASRPKVVSPATARKSSTSGYSSKTISPPAGSQGRLAPAPPPGTPPLKPNVSQSLGMTPKPPAGPPPSPKLAGTPVPIRASSDAPRNPVSPIVYVPATTYSPSASKAKPPQEAKRQGSMIEASKKELEPSSSSASESRAAPARQMAMGFPVVPPLDPHVFPKRTSPATEQGSASSPSPSPILTASPSPNAAAAAPHKTSKQIDIRNTAIGAQTHRANSPDMSRKEGDHRNSRPIEVNKPHSPLSDNGAHSPTNRGLNNSPSLSPAGSSGASPRAGQGFFPVVDTIRAGLSKARDGKSQGNKSPDASQREQDGGASIKSGHEESECRTDPRDLKVGPKGASPPASQSKPRFQFDNFYSLSDPYKELNVDEPTDFFSAVTQGDLETIERLLKLHPYLIHESIGFWPHPTPILVAARSRHALDTMKVLVKNGAALDRGDHNGTTVLHFVCEQYPNPTEAVIFLTKAGADCNSRDSKKRTPLMVLLQNSHITSTKTLVEAMRVLFKFGAQTKVTDHQFQRTPLHYAIQHCREPASVIELLLKKGADANAVDSRKTTPLHMVLERMDNEEIVQMLLLYGADPSLKNSNKRNALCVAAENLRVMSAWFLLENDLLSSAPDTIKKANELCSKADGPDKNSKPLFKNLLSDWQGKEGKIRRIQLAQDCVLRVQRTPDMKTIDQTQVALEFLESAGASIKANDQDNLSNGSLGGNSSNNNNNSGNNGNNSYGPASTGGAGGSPGLLRLRHFANSSANGNNGNNINGGLGGSGGNNNNNINGHHGHHAGGNPGGSGPNSHPPFSNNNNNGHVQVKELRLAEGVEPLKQTMLPVKSVQQLEKEREAIRNQLKYANMSNAFV